MFLEVILEILLILGIGLILRRVGILNEHRVDLLNKVAFYIALPALIFHSIYSRSLGEIFSPDLILGFFIVLISILLLGWERFRDIEETGLRSVAITQSYHGNLGYMGLPVVAVALGESAGAKASILVGTGSMIQIVLTTIILVQMNSPKGSLRDNLERVILNPVLLSLIVGLTFSYLNLSLTQTLGDAISLVSDSALPIALLGVGASIKLEVSREDWKIPAEVTTLKIITMPVLGWIVLSIISVDPISLKTGVLMLGMPTAVSTFIYSKELGGDEEFASLNISLTTLFSMISVAILLAIFS